MHRTTAVLESWFVMERSKCWSFARHHLFRMTQDRPVDLIEASLLLYDHEFGRQLPPLSRREVRELREGGRFYYCIAQPHQQRRPRRRARGRIRRVALLLPGHG
jgi:hypothetical protein